MKNVSKSTEDCVVALPRGEDTLIRGIKCRDCLQILPSMSVRQYLSGDFNKKCCSDKRDKAIIDTTVTRVEELRVKYNTLAKNYIADIGPKKDEYCKGYYDGFYRACKLILAYLQNDKINEAEQEYKILSRAAA